MNLLEEKKSWMVIDQWKKNCWQVNWSSAWDATLKNVEADDFWMKRPVESVYTIILSLEFIYSHENQSGFSLLLPLSILLLFNRTLFVLLHFLLSLCLLMLGNVPSLPPPVSHLWICFFPHFPLSFFFLFHQHLSFLLFPSISTKSY